MFDLLLIPRVRMWAMGLLKLMNGEYLMEHQNFLDVSKLPPYHLQPKYNLAEKLWSDLTISLMFFFFFFFFVYMERDHFGFHKISVTKTKMKMKMKMRQKKDFMKLPMKKMIQKDLMKLQVLLRYSRNI